jgi:hypothetical protein
MIDRCSTSTPFGLPVEPDVYITYARSFAVARSSNASRLASPATPAGASSMNSVCAASVASFAACARRVTSTGAAASSTTNARRSRG